MVVRVDHEVQRAKDFKIAMRERDASMARYSRVECFWILGRSVIGLLRGRRPKKYILTEHGATLTSMFMFITSYRVQHYTLISRWG